MKVIVYEIPLKKHQTRSREILEECATRYIPSKQEVSRGFAQIYIVLRDRLNACTRTRTHETSSSCGRVLVKRKSNSFFLRQCSEDWPEEILVTSHDCLFINFFTQMLTLLYSPFFHPFIFFSYKKVLSILSNILISNIFSRFSKKKFQFTKLYLYII